MGHAPRFNINEFAKFLSKEEDVKRFFDIKEEINPMSKFVGHTAKTKVSKDKLLEKIEVPVGDEYELVEEFCKEGGTITDTNGKNLCIETDNGSFEIPRFCVKVLRNS